MAEQLYFNFITDIGIAKISNAILYGRKVEITHFAVGDGDGSYYRPTPAMTALKGEVWRGPIASTVLDPDSIGNLLISTVIPSDVGGFVIREMAVFDKDGDMIAISNTADIEKVAVSAGMSSEIELTLSLLVSNTEAISFQVDPTVIVATKRDILHHDESPSAHADIRQSIANLTAADVGALPATEKGTAGGVASLDSTGKLAAAQIPDVLGKVKSVAGKAPDAAGNVALAAADIGAVPAETTVNGKALGENITLSYADVGAAAESHSHSGYASTSHTHTAAQVGAAAASHSHSGYASSSHSHTASQVGAAAANHTHSGYASSSHSHTASQVGAVPSSGGSVSGGLYCTSSSVTLASDYFRNIIISTGAPSGYKNGDVWLQYS